MGNSGSFTPLSAELLTLVFCQLPSFDDVFSLAFTCHHVRDVWLNNVSSIYKHVARVSIACEHYARIFLAAQTGRTFESSIISAQDVLQMMKNQRSIERVIHQFERQIVSKVKTRGYRPEEYYGTGARRHPPYLTRSERPRFIRAYYQLWGLLTIENQLEWRSRLQRMSLKQLFQLCEISWLPDGLGPGEEEMSTAAVGSRSMSANRQQQVEARRALSKLVLQMTGLKYQWIHGQDVEMIWVIAMDEGYQDFLVMWDHWQDSLKETVCGRWAKEPPYKKELHWDLWEDTSDEDL